MKFRKRLVLKFFALFVLSIGVFFVSSNEKVEATSCAYDAYLCRLNCLAYPQGSTERAQCNHSCGSQYDQCYQTWLPAPPEYMEIEQNPDMNCYWRQEMIQTCLNVFCPNNQCSEDFDACIADAESQFPCHF